MPDGILEFLSRLLVIFIAFPLHEFAHAWTADYFGDDTPYHQGRITLNPLKHLEWMGAILFMLTGFGWAKPVQVNPYALNKRSRWGALFVPLAGPVMNMLLAVIVALLLRAVYPTVSGLSGILLQVFQLGAFFVFFNIILALFNMLPLVPLDGEKVLVEILPPAGQDFMLNFRRYSIGPFLVVIFLLPQLGIYLLPYLIGQPTNMIFRLLMP